MLDIEVNLDVLEFIHTTAGGEGVQVLFCILSGHSKGSELLVNAQFPHSLIAACTTIHKLHQSKVLNIVGITYQRAAIPIPFQRLCFPPNRLHSK